MSESDAAKAVHPLVQLVLSAKAILEAHVEPMGPSKAETIAALRKLFDGDQEALGAHDRLVAEVAALRVQIAAKDEIANSVLSEIKAQLARQDQKVMELEGLKNRMIVALEASKSRFTRLGRSTLGIDDALDAAGAA